MPPRSDDPPLPGPLRFGPFTLEMRLGMLSRDGAPVKVPPRPFALLCYLARHAGRVVPKHELLDAVWGHQHLSESSLKATVNNLRRALGEPGSSSRWITSVARRGYRFTLDDAAPAPAVPPAALAAVPAVGDGTLIGRAREFAQLQTLLATHRLVTLTGSAGIGKTHLALAALPQLAQACRDGAWLLRLDSIVDADTLVATLAHTLRLSPEAARDLDALCTALRTLAMGIVLDNCEHLLLQLPALVAQLLAQAPGLRLLCTSQQALGLAGEQLLPLGPLAVPAAAGDDLAHSGAAQLLLARIRRHDRQFQLQTGQQRSVAAICRALDGVPLELELAAARVPLLGLAGVQTRLPERLDMLRQHGQHGQGAQPAPDGAARHRSLRNALAWSHALLPPQQQCVLRRLAVFEGSFSIAAAEAVVADEGLDRWDVLDAVAALAERSLLAGAGSAPAAAVRRRQHDEAGPDDASPAAPHTVPRWRMLHGIHAFALEQLDQAGETAVLRERHARWMQDLLAQAGPRVHDMAPQDWLAQLEPELDNLRAALRHAQRSDAALAWALWALSVMFWVRSGLKHEALRWQRALGELQAAAGPSTLKADVAQARGVLCVLGLALPPQEGLQAMETAHRLHRAAGDAVAAYYDLYLLAMIQIRLQLPHPAGTLAAMQALEQPGWSTALRRYGRWTAAMLRRQAGDLDGYHQAMREEQAFARHLGDRNTVWLTGYALALAEHERGDVAQALAQLGQICEQIAAAGQQRSQPSQICVHAAMLLWHGAETAASPRVHEAVALLRADGSLWTLAGALPWLPWWNSRPADAARLLGWADAMIAAAGERRGPFFARLQAALEARLGAALAADAAVSLRREGAQLSEPAALALAFGPVPPGPPAVP